MQLSFLLLSYGGIAVVWVVSVKTVTFQLIHSEMDPFRRTETWNKALELEDVSCF